mmetsp:Transcript_2228/g.1590  ORF Transcript_2228/g.1590 Transcript_2228/m.1590 type:complete len:82 (-) Transcript_2228:70-315(-)
MINEVSESKDFSVSFEQFRAMRVLKKACEFNVLAEFKKFDIHKLMRGQINSDCVRKVLKAEGLPQDLLDLKVKEIMQLDQD